MSGIRVNYGLGPVGWIFLGFGVLIMWTFAIFVAAAAYFVSLIFWLVKLTWRSYARWRVERRAREKIIYRPRHSYALLSQTPREYDPPIS